MTYGVPEWSEKSGTLLFLRFCMIAERTVSSSKFKVQSFKFENAPEISQKALNLERGTLDLIELPALVKWGPP